MKAYGLRKLLASFIRIAKNSISLCYNPYTSFKMNGACTCAYNHALLPIYNLESEVFSLSCIYVGAILLNLIKVCYSKS